MKNSIKYSKKHKLYYCGISIEKEKGESLFNYMREIGLDLPPYNIIFSNDNDIDEEYNFIVTHKDKKELIPYEMFINTSVSN